MGGIYLFTFRAVLPGRNQRCIRILYVVAQLTAIGAIPDIADHAVYRWCCPRCQGGVTHDGFGVGMQVVSIAEDHTLVAQVVQTMFAEIF